MKDRNILITDDMVHKTILLKTKCKNLCGRESEIVEKKYFVKCKEVSPDILPTENTTVYFIASNGYMAQPKLYPEIFFIGGNVCTEFYYELSKTNYKDVTLTSPKTEKFISPDELLKAFDESTSRQENYLKVTVRAFCKVTEEWRGEQQQYTLPICFVRNVVFKNDADDMMFQGVIGVNSYFDICVYNTIGYTVKIRYTTDGTDPKLAESHTSNITGDYSGIRVNFTKVGEYTVRAIAEVNGILSSEKKDTVKVMSLTMASDDFGILSDEGIAVIGNY